MFLSSLSLPLPLPLSLPCLFLSGLLKSDSPHNSTSNLSHNSIFEDQAEIAIGIEDLVSESSIFNMDGSSTFGR